MKFLVKILPCITIVLILSSCASNVNKAPFTAARANFEQQNYEEAFNKIQGPAKAGNAEAEYALGYMYYYGKGTPVNQELGKKWILKSAQASNRNAQQAYQMILAREQQIVPDKTSSKETGKQMESATVAGKQAKHAATVSSTAVVAKQTVKAATIVPATTIKASHNTAKPHYTTDEHSLLAANGKYYALQLLAASKASYAADYISKHKLGVAAKYFHRKINGKDLYIVVYGNYPTHQAAVAGIKTLPQDVQKLKPWIRHIADIQAHIMSPGAG